MIKLKLNHIGLGWALNPLTGVTIRKEGKDTCAEYRDYELKVGGNFLSVQWLGLSSFTADLGSILGQETKITKLHHAAPKKETKWVDNN